MVNGYPLNAGCETLFGQGTARCKLCGAQCNASFPFFSTCLTWCMQDWKDIATTLNSATPFPWFHNGPWHKGDCARNDGNMQVSKAGPWTFLQMQPTQKAHYPSINAVSQIINDPSLPKENLAVKAFPCSNLREDQGNHYWLVEPKTGGSCNVYYS